MARYYLHLHECGTYLPDEEGMELPDYAAAYAQAVTSAREVMGEEIKGGKLCLSCLIVIEDAAKLEVGRVPFSEAVAVSGV